MPTSFLLLLLAATPASAEPFARITDRGAFLALVAEKELRLGLFDISLRLSPDGRSAARRSAGR